MFWSSMSIVGLLGLGVVVLLVVIFVNALSKSRNIGRTLAAGALGAVTVGIIVVVALALLITVASNTTIFHADKRAPVELGVTENGQASMPANQFQDVVGLIGPAALAQPQAPQSTGVTVAGTPWSNAVEEFQDFEADVYPSIESAAKALGRRVGLRLMEATPTGDRDTRSIYVWRDKESGDVTRDVLEAVASGLRQKLDEPGYVSVERPASKDAVAVRVAIQEVHFENHKRWGRKSESQSGGIALRVEVPGGPFSVSTRFTDTPWVTDRTAFAKKFSKGDWLVAYSDGTHTTHEEARRDAISAAADVLLPLAQARIGQLSASDQQHYRQQLAKDLDWLRSRVADELVSRNMLTDQFTQSFDRPYGTVWREAVLVDASPKRVQAIAQSLVQGVQSRVAHTRTTWFSFFGLGGLIFGTYLFLNMATKGYYVWALRLATVAGLGAAGFVVTHLL